MDGQLLGLARAGLLGGDLMVPRFVLDEVQGFADAPDEARSRRAHRGLETLEVIERDGPVRVFVLDDEVPEHAEVDAKLAALARRLAAAAAHQRRPARAQRRAAGRRDVQPPATRARARSDDHARRLGAGDDHEAGNERGQGVGQLDDGSMVVVNGGI